MLFELLIARSTRVLFNISTVSLLPGRIRIRIEIVVMLVGRPNLFSD